MKSCVLACCLILTLSLVTEGQELGREANKRAWKSRGGWSFNSVGYNGGLNALKQFIRRRSSGGAYDESAEEANAPTSSNSYENGVDYPLEGFDTIEALLRDFDLFLKLKENGNFDDELVKCIMRRAEGELEF